MIKLILTLCLFAATKSARLEKMQEEATVVESQSRQLARAKLTRNAVEITDGYLSGAKIASHIFLVKAPKITWEGARAACKTKGGDLAVLATYAAVEAVANLVADTTSGVWFLGAKNLENGFEDEKVEDKKVKKDTWKWLTGEPLPLNFGKWANGQPDANPESPCLAYCNLDKEKGLCDYYCDRNSLVEGYICQIPSK